MRTAVINTVHKIMSKNKNVYLWTGDLGYTALEEIEQDYPDKFINVGVAEQNMIGVASGLALSGKTVFVYSIIPFVTMRCYEQIRDDACYHNLNIKIIGVGSGLSYGVLGSTHFALEDIGIMRCLPNMTVISPADPVEAELATKKIFIHPGPVYLRLGKKGEPTIYKGSYNFEIGKPKILIKGKNIIIFSHGGILFNVLEAANILKESYKIDPTVINMHTIKPVDKEFILDICKTAKMSFVVEEHSVIGGLGSTIAEILSQESNMPILKIIGTNDLFIKHIGTQDYIRKKLSFDPNGIVKIILKSVMENLKSPEF